MFKVQAKAATPTGSQFDKQVDFALAVALTQTAKDSQGAVIGSLEETFTLRNKWYLPSNKFGVRVKAAKKTDLVAEVYTGADWLLLHEESGIKLPEGRFIAIPTKNVRRTKRQIIQKGQRPKALIGKRDFIIKTKKAGRLVIMQRTGRGKNTKVKAMYVLVPRAAIKRESTILSPTERIVAKNFGQNFSKALTRAIATARL